MIGTLRRKFVISVMFAILIVMLSVLGMVNVMLAMNMNRILRTRLDFISKYSGNMPYDFHEDVEDGSLIEYESALTDEFLYEARYFSVTLKSDGSVSSYATDHIAAINGREAVELAERTASLPSDFGFLVNGRNSYVWQVTERADGSSLVVFLDYTRENLSTMATMRLSAQIGIISYLIIFVLVFCISRWAVQPMAENIEKQKQFITNAGHELKTPLAIIAANTEVIEMTNGESEWTESTLKQIKRLSALINNMIVLSRMEESREDIVPEVVDITALAREAAGSISPVITNDGKGFETEIPDNIELITDRKFLNEIIFILLDNAAKYCDEGGTVRFTVFSQGRQVSIEVSNEYAKGESVDYNRFFDRFYRGDKSHNSQKAGFGIGLSMASEMVSALKGKILSSWKDGRISFTVLLGPLKLPKKMK